MKKKILLLIALIFTIGLLYKYSDNSSLSEKTLKEKHAEFLKNHPYNKSLALTKKERKAIGIPPNKYFEQQYLLEMNPNTGRTHPENIFNLQEELKAQRKLQRVPGDASDNMWVERGPNNVGGRTRVVMFDPNDATHKRVFAGGATGGLWVNNDITDVNSSWIRVGIDENLAVSCMTVDPNNSQIMYIGTGESQANPTGTGNGIWKSIDGGSSWVNVFNDNLNFDIQERLFYINAIKAWNNPNTSKTEIFVGIAGAHGGNSQFPGAKKTGLYKSIDDGVNWNKVILPLIPGREAFTYSSQYEPNDIEISSDNTVWIGTENNIYGHGGGTVLKSTTGSVFSVEHTVANGKRTEIALSKTNKDKIYILCDTGTPKILLTTNSFNTVTNIAIPTDADTGIPNTDFTRGQAFYDLVIEVDPTNDNIVYVGGIDLFRSSNNGTTWKQISKWSNNNFLSTLNIPLVHADQHVFTFHPNDANKAVIGNDGGVFYASSLSTAETTPTSIEGRNKDYNVTQFYHGEIGQSTSNNMLLAGAQDNGTHFVQNANAGVNGTNEVYGGDGAYSFIDKKGEYIISSYVYNVKARLNLPNTSIGVTLDNDQTTGRFINPQDLDDNLDILYANGNKFATAQSPTTYDSIVRYSNVKPGQTFIKKKIGNSQYNANASVLKVSPYTTTSTKLFVGLENGKLLRVINANSNVPSWSNIGSGSFVGSISDIAFGTNENEIMVTMHNYGVKSIWYTSNGGTNWFNKEGNFPDIPVKAIMMNPLNNDEVIIGTELGVWRTSNFKDASPKWIQSQNGMSNVKVTSFSLRTADNTVMASTYGRGMFTGQFSAGVVSVDEVVKDSKVFTMYPTVSNGDFTVFAKNTLGKAKLHMFDINGKQVFTKQLDFTQQSKQPISVNLKAGVYIVNLIDSNNKKATSKVVIK